MNYSKNNETLFSLVMQAKEGNQNAVSALYEKTYSQVFYTVRSMIKDEDTVLDIVQDTYLKAFSHLDSFDGGDTFVPWVKQIAANTTRDWLKKKRPTLFSELSSTEDDEDRVIEEQFVDERTSSLPEQMIDEEETKRLLREIIDSLPEDQRAVIGMFYYEDMSIKEIAMATGSSESAIKSRLMYGRKKIEKSVRELEKRGTKLYNLAPIPFLLLLFRSQKTYASELPNEAIRRVLLQKLASNTLKTTAAASAKAAAVQAGKAAGVNIVTKIVIGIIAAAALVGAGIFGISRLQSGNTASQKTVSETSVTTDEVMLCEDGHTWQDATCSAPRTCKVCGETEGEPLEHSWIEATCQAPRTCGVCGETEGEASEHSWIEANYQAPQTCEICGETEGEVLPAYYETTGLASRFLDPSGEYEITLSCLEEGFHTVGKFSVDSYAVISGDEDHEALDGYEWMMITFKLHLDDDNMWNYGLNRWWDLWDSYYIPSTFRDNRENEDLHSTGKSYIVNWNGMDYTDGLIITNSHNTGWLVDEDGNNYVDAFVDVAVRLPLGYDGFVFVIESYEVDIPANTYMADFITDNALFFRFE